VARFVEADGAHSSGMPRVKSLSARSSAVTGIEVSTRVVGDEADLDLVLLDRVRDLAAHEKSTDDAEVAAALGYRIELTRARVSSVEAPPRALTQGEQRDTNRGYCLGVSRRGDRRCALAERALGAFVASPRTSTRDRKLDVRAKGPVGSDRRRLRSAAAMTSEFFSTPPPRKAGLELAFAAKARTRAEPTTERRPRLGARGSWPPCRATAALTDRRPRTPCHALREGSRRARRGDGR
jgi:uncharacterized membrane protein